MEEIIVNRFKTYRKLRWIRSNYLWQSSENKYLNQFKIKIQDESNLPCDVLSIPLPHLPGKENVAHKDTHLYINEGVRGEFDYQDVPILCDSSFDYSYLGPVARHLLSFPQVRVLSPNVAYRNDVTQWRRASCGEYYGSVYDNVAYYHQAPTKKQDRPKFSLDIRKKIKPPIRPPTAPLNDDLIEYVLKKQKRLSSRSIDVGFAGRVNYGSGNRSYPSRNRNDMLKAFKRLKVKNTFLLTYDDFKGTKWNGKQCKKLKFPYEYLDNLMDTKIVLSPWGWGTWCIRDFEALICGCIVIKPVCTNTLTYSDIYDPNKQFFVWLDVLWNTLENSVDYCLSNLDEFQPRVLEARKFLLDHIYPNDKLYYHWTKNIRSYLEECCNTRSYASAETIPGKDYRVFKRD